MNPTNSNRMAAMASTSLAFACSLVGCGGGSGDFPVTVARSVASYDITGTVDSQRKALAAAGVAVIMTTCFETPRPNANRTVERITEDRPPAVLYVHQIREADKGIAMTLGFIEDYSMEEYSAPGMPCATLADIPANDTPANDTPANGG